MIGNAAPAARLTGQNVRRLSQLKLEKVLQFMKEQRLLVTCLMETWQVTPQGWHSEDVDSFLVIHHGEMAVRGACDREIRPSRLMFFLSPIVEVQPGNVNVAKLLQFRSTTSPWRAADAGERDGRTKEVCYVIYGTWLALGISPGGLPARGAALNSYDKREIRGTEPGGAHHRTTEYHEPEPEWGESPHHPRRKLTRQA